MKQNDTEKLNGWSLQELLTENERRNAALHVDYDPLRGTGCCGERVQLSMPQGTGQVWAPASMAGHDYGTKIEFERARIACDFEFWCARCVKIHDKRTGRDVAFVLNAPQRRVLREMERQRLSGQGIRIILLKARQWGGSTLVLIYMAWIQLVLQRNWNSLICGHKLGTSAAIRGIYRRLMRNYPRELLPGGKPLRFTNFEGCRTVQHIEGRDCLVIEGTAQSDDVVRGYDIAMAHLSEVAFWPQSTCHDPQDVVRSIDGSILMGGLSLEVMESTANGMGSFFHTEWLRAEAGQSDKTPIFVPWHEIELYRLPVPDVAALWASLDDYERNLWEHEGCTLEAINWYHHKRRVYASPARMMAEFPTTALEAFSGTSRCVFDLHQLDEMRTDCCAPRFTGDIVGPAGSLEAHLNADATGQLSIWLMPEEATFRSRYVVSVDVGGRSDESDWSVITVIDRHLTPQERPEIAAQWRGHIDHDLLAWKAAQLAHFYHKALLVFESNTLETGQAEGDDGVYILEQLAGRYRNLYLRENGRPGFQTNRHTKAKIVHALIKQVRDHSYVEHDQQAVDEMSWFELQPGSRFGAVKGKHDDIVMSRAIGLYVASTLGRKPLLRDSDFLSPHAPVQMSLHFFK